jgi:hypothetical protein
MIMIMIYLLQLGSHSVAVVGRLVQNGKETAQKEKQYVHKTIKRHRIRKIENPKYKNKK